MVRGDLSRRRAGREAQKGREMSRTDKFTAHGAFYRAEARADGESWMITLYRNGSLATVTGEYRGPPQSLNDRALAFAFEAAVRDLADQGIWEPGATAGRASG
jgi:hypothetical protein